MAPRAGAQIGRPELIGQPRTHRPKGRTDVNETIRKFGYPDTLLKEYGPWVVLMRPAQATLGALILGCSESATRFSDISPAAFDALQPAIADIERALSQTFDYQKLNYLMLMMVDPHVHFHVLPRYAGDQTFRAATFSDPGWPGPPALGHDNALDDATRAELLAQLKASFA